MYITDPMAKIVTCGTPKGQNKTRDKTDQQEPIQDLTRDL